MKTRLTFSAEVWAQIIRRWGSEAAWKTWVKEQTKASLNPNQNIYQDRY